MGARKPGSQGERDINVKTVVQGMPGDLAGPVVTAACFFAAGGPWGRPAPGIPCALFASEGGTNDSPGAMSRRGNAAVRVDSCLKSFNQRTLGVLRSVEARDVASSRKHALKPVAQHSDDAIMRARGSTPCEPF